MMKRVLCIWLPTWPIQRLLVARPEWHRRAILVHARQGNRGQRIIAYSAAAQAAGVRCGMPLTEATALMRQSCETVSYDPEGDEQELTRLAEWCEKFSPIVGLEQVGPARAGSAQTRAEQRDAAGRESGTPQAPESLLLDVTGLGPLFGGEDSLARKIATEFAGRGYVARVAIGDSVGAAWAAARFATRDGLMVIPPGQSFPVLAPLPLAALRLPAATMELMWPLGIQRVEQLLRLPRASLSSRFGDEVLLRIDQALGNLREPIVARRPSPEFHADWILEYAADRRDVVELVVRQLIVRVAHLLAEQNRGAVRLEIHLQCLPLVAADAGEENISLLVFRVDLFRPATTASHLWELVRLQLDQATLPGPVQRVAVHAPLTAPRESRQGELFTDLHGDRSRDCRQDDQQLALLIDRLSSRLGRQQVLRPHLVMDAQPERACRYLPLAGRKPAGKKNRPKKTRRKKTRERQTVHDTMTGDTAAANTAETHETAQPQDAVPQILTLHPVDRPLYLVHPPLPLSVVAAMPDGPPARLRHQHDWHTIVRYWGPERIETGWWRGPTLRRDYYRVETETGLWFWLFRRLDTGQWFLHGHFV